MTASRKPIPNSTIADLLVSTRRRCCLCYFLAQDKSQKKVQIAHIDRKRNNDSPDNLIPLCLEHHDEYDSRTSQSKGITEEEVRRYKSMLIAAFSDGQNDAPIDINVEEREIPKLGNDLFYGYGVLFSQVSRILFKHDPIGISCYSGLDDEYDPEAHDIISRLQDNRACLPTKQICKSVFEHWFSPEIAGKVRGYKKLAKDIDVAWKHFKTRSYVYGPNTF